VLPQAETKGRKHISCIPNVIHISCGCLPHTSLLVWNVTVCMYLMCGPGSVVGIATGYGLDGPGIESRWVEIFRTCPDRPWGPPSLLYSGYPVFPRGKERPGRDVGHERLKLYLYSPYGPYGLYRASVLVEGCILPYLFMYLMYFPWPPLKT